MANPLKNKLRIAALGDLHIRGPLSTFKPIFETIGNTADVLLLCGDLTDSGDPAEAEYLIEDLKVCKIPVLAVLGNHDFDQGKNVEIKQILKKGRVVVLENEPYELKDTGFAGAKGFGGGFDKYMISPFGEETIKRFVYESVNEALQLEKNLSNLRSNKKVVVLHYSPIKDTVIGEAPEILPFVGSSRLAEPIEHFKATIVFHGHAHKGSFKGKTISGIPVYNVSFPLMVKLNPKQPYFLGEI